MSTDANFASERAASSTPQADPMFTANESVRRKRADADALPAHIRRCGKIASRIQHLRGQIEENAVMVACMLAGDDFDVTSTQRNPFTGEETTSTDADPTMAAAYKALMAANAALHDARVCLLTKLPTPELEIFC